MAIQLELKAIHEKKADLLKVNDRPRPEQPHTGKVGQLRSMARSEASGKRGGGLELHVREDRDVAPPRSGMDTHAPGGTGRRPRASGTPYAAQARTDGCGERRLARARAVGEVRVRRGHRKRRRAGRGAHWWPGWTRRRRRVVTTARGPSAQLSTAVAQCPKRTSRAIFFAAPDLPPPPEGYLPVVRRKNSPSAVASRYMS